MSQIQRLPQKDLLVVSANNFSVKSFDAYISGFCQLRPYHTGFEKHVLYALRKVFYTFKLADIGRQDLGNFFKSPHLVCWISELTPNKMLKWPG